jgi:hypothetical protein
MVFFEGLARTGGRTIMVRSLRPRLSADNILIESFAEFVRTACTFFSFLGRTLGRGRSIAVIAIFQIIFAGAIASFARARPGEIFGVTLA